MKKLLLIFTLLLINKSEANTPFACPYSLLQSISEEQKIEKLISSIEKSDAIFIRNGTEYPAKEAADHLRMKRKKAGNKVKTAKDFIDLIASKSYMSGEAYKMKFKNGSTINTRDMLYNELRKLEKN
ncbi:MAG: DUF5329 family protein [Bacteroidia bacterium]